MSSSNVVPYSLFSAFGVELEYMVVDATSLDVRPIADRVLGTEGEVERGSIGWSNELTAHVIELKVAEPVASLEQLAENFQQNVREIDTALAELGARLMPAGMHPWMDPAREARLWPHEYSEVYAAFDRIFGSRGHGWSNLQSTHLNLPFAGDEEFGRLHAAIRLLLPILPALTASSPVLEGRLTGLLDNRLEVYRTNSQKIPAIAGRVIPEPVFSQAAYETEILARLYRDIAPHDPGGVLQHEWLNARGAIARFTRNAIEIRVMDVQECPQADLAICAAVVATLTALVEERFAPLAAQQAVAIDPLEKILLATIRDAEKAGIDDDGYLALFNMQAGEMSVNALWRRLLDVLVRDERLSSVWLPTLDVILEEGPLARRIVSALTKQGFVSGNRQVLGNVYARMCSCLDEGRLFRAGE